MLEIDQVDLGVQQIRYFYAVLFVELDYLVEKLLSYIAVGIYRL